MRSNHHSHRIVGSILMILMVMLAACSTVRSGAGPQLTGTQWRLVALNGQPPVPATSVTLNFNADNQVGGNGSCNSFGGTYTTSGNSLKIAELASTMMACADQAINEQESAYFQALQSVATYEIANNQLTLKDANGTVLLVFARA